MQTFLPYADFIDSARVLDRQRLGKQRVEAWQIIAALQGHTRGWVNHPATRAWRGHTRALALYGLAVCTEWISRGYEDSLAPRFRTVLLTPVDENPEWVLPSWFGDADFHRSHQSNLIRKAPEYYAHLFPGVPDDLPYVWPV